MAQDIFFTGFEGGKRDWDSAQSNTLFVDDGNARTGEYYLHCYLGVAAGNNGKISGPVPVSGQSLSDAYAKGVTRVFFEIVENVILDHVMIMGYCPDGTPASGGILQLKVNRTFAANCYGTVGTYSTAVLALNTKYRADLSMTLTDSGAASSASVSISVYTEAGVLIETVTSSASGLPNAPSFPRPSLGHHDAVVTTYNFKFDDWYSQVVANQTPAFPTATRITRVDAISMSGAGWSGVYQNITTIPFSDTAVGAVVSINILDAKVKFSHKSATLLGLSGIEGFNLYSHIKANTLGDEDVLINDAITVVAVDTTYSTYPYLVQQMGTLSLLDFNSMTFGVQNRRAQTVTVAQQYMEVLHAGDNLPRDLTGEDSWKHKVTSFIANGSFGEVTGIGFRPQVVLLKKANGTNASGFFKVGCNGGTQSRVIDAVTVDSLAIMYMTDDGFTYGPSLEAGMTYAALCIQDGGVAEDCKFLRYGAFVGVSGLSNTVVVKTSWEPDFIMVQGDDILLWASDVETVGDSVPLNNSATATGYIATITSSGFTFGTNLDNGRVYYYFAIRMLTGLSNLFAYNKFTAAGATHDVTGLTFQPGFAIGKRIAAIIAQWRSTPIHTLAESTIWNTTVVNNNGITAFNANGLSFGSNLSNAGDVTKWLAFKNEGEISVASLTPTANAGPDQVVDVFSANLDGTAGAGSYPCAVLSYLWELVSGPTGSIIASPTAIDTSVTFTQAGIYIFRLTVSNGAESASDTVQITVSCGSPTSVNAGPDQTVLFGTVVQLDGEVVE